MTRYNPKRIKQRTFDLKILADKFQDKAISMVNEAESETDQKMAIFGLVVKDQIRLKPVPQVDLLREFPSLLEEYQDPKEGEILFFVSQHSKGYLRVLSATPVVV